MTAPTLAAPTRRAVHVRRPDVWTGISVAIMILFLVFLVFPLWGIFKVSVVGDGGGWTLHWFVKFFTNDYYLSTIRNSFVVSIAATVVSLVLGVPFSYFYTFFKLRGARFLFIGAVLSVMSAPFIGAYSWILLLGRNGVLTQALESVLPIHVPSIYGFGGIVLVLSLKLFPLISVYMNGAFRSIDSSLLEAASLMGSNGWKRVVQLMLRLTIPTVLAASLLVFMRAFADFGVPILIGEGYRTFTVEIYKQYLGEIGQNHNFAAAIGIIGLAVTTAVFLLQKYAVGKFQFSMQASRPIEKRKPTGIKGALMYLYMYGVIAVALLPQVYIVYLSFRNSSQVIFKPGYSLDNYRRAASRLLGRSLWNTLWFAAVAMIIIIVLSVLISYLVVRRTNLANNVIDTLSMLPYILPGAVIAIGLVLAFNGPPLAITGTAAIMILALVVRRMPYTIRSATATLMQQPKSMEEAARSLGASKIKAFVKVTMPMMSKGIRSGAVISFVMIAIEMSSGIILYNNRTITLTMSAYVAITRGDYGMACAFASVLTLVTAVVMMVYLAITREEDVQM